MTSSIFEGDSRKIDLKITKINRIRFRHRRPEVTSQCDRLGNESRRPTERRNRRPQRNGFFDGADFVASAVYRSVEDDFGGHRLDTRRFCFSRRKDLREELVAYVFGPHPFPALFFFCSSGALSDKPELILGLQDFASIWVCRPKLFLCRNQLFGVFFLSELL